MALDLKPGLEKWHHQLHMVTGGMVLNWTKATEAMILNWADDLAALSKEMIKHAKKAGVKDVGLQKADRSKRAKVRK